MSWDLDVQPRHAVRTAPPKLWRNWWIAPWCGELTDGRIVSAGDFVASPVAHPSRDIARTKAAEYLVDARRRGIACMDYIDAFPEGQSPASGWAPRSNENEGAR